MPVWLTGPHSPTARNCPASTPPSGDHVMNTNEPPVQGNIPSDVVRIFDTTLRDGEQSPGATMNSAEKLEVARQLARAGRRHHRGRLPGGLARRPRGGAPHRPGGRQEGRPGDRRAGALLARRHRQGVAGRARSRAPAHPHVPGHLRPPPGAQARHDARAGADADRAHGRPRAQSLRRRRVQPRGRVALRARVPGAKRAGLRSRPARPRSTFPTPWATRCRSSTASSSPS